MATLPLLFGGPQRFIAGNKVKSGPQVGMVHGGRRQPMCDPEGCLTVWGAIRGGPPPPSLTQT